MVKLLILVLDNFKSGDDLHHGSAKATKRNSVEEEPQHQLTGEMMGGSVCWSGTTTNQFWWFPLVALNSQKTNASNERPNQEVDRLDADALHWSHLHQQLEIVSPRQCRMWYTKQGHSAAPSVSHDSGSGILGQVWHWRRRKRRPSATKPKKHWVTALPHISDNSILHTFCYASPRDYPKKSNALQRKRLQWKSRVWHVLANRTQLFRSSLVVGWDFRVST